MKKFIILSLVLQAFLLSPIQISSTISNGCAADYIIVGLGTSGATLARFLSNDNSVLVLEAGVNLATDSLVLSPNITDAFVMWPDPKYSLTSVPNYGTYVEGVSGLNTGLLPEPYTDGRMWGGSSAHNGMLAVRGSTADYDHWAAVSGNVDWSYSNMLPLMLYMEHYIANGTAADTQQRGLSGPMFISQAAPAGNYSFMQNFATAVSAPLVPDYNDPTNNGQNPKPNYLNVGVSANQTWTTQVPPNGERSFSINGFLPKSVIDYNTGKGLNGRKLQVVSSATVVRVLFNGTKAVGVELILNGNREEVLTVFANKEVILSSGSIHDAAILQRSGIGDKTLLDSLKIPVVYNNPNVGANLQNHYGPVGAVTLSTGALAPFNIYQSFFDIAPSTGVRRIQSFFQAGAALFPQPEVLRLLGVQNPGVMSPIVTVPFQLVKNSSRGTVKIISTDPFIDPEVNFNFYSDGSYQTPGTDAANAVACFKMLQNIQGSTVIYPTQADFDSGDEQLFIDAQNMFLIQDHAAGTCSMASSADNGVVNGNLQVFGVSNLRVVSVAIEPTIETGNPAYTAYLIGLRAALLLGSSLK